MESKKLPKSLTDIAYEAGFRNLHNISARFSGFLGSVISDEFEILYYRPLVCQEPPLSAPDKSTPIDEIEIFAVKDQYDYDSCALYRFRTSLGKRRSIGGENKGLRIEKQNPPLYKGKTAVKVLMAYIPEEKPKE
ncbi:hypothetical protein KY348_07225 [Candidatus Woesearchaeota archaeon]|nr:hypothetical protein [Candidatus Woesearchaeota archaeon]